MFCFYDARVVVFYVYVRIFRFWWSAVQRLLKFIDALHINSFNFMFL